MTLELVLRPEEDKPAILNPATGAVVPLTDAATDEIAEAHDALADLASQIREAQALASDELLVRMDRRGKWTADVGGFKLKSQSPTAGTTDYDAEGLRTDLLALANRGLEGPGGRTAGATTPPERSLQQRRDALQTANASRAARAALKKVIAGAGPVEGRYRVAEMILVDDPAPEFVGMPVWDLLMAVPGAGRVKVNRLLIVAQVSPSKKLGGLSDRQRETIARIVSDGASRHESHLAWAASRRRSAETERD